MVIIFTTIIVVVTLASWICVGSASPQVCSNQILQAQDTQKASQEPFICIMDVTLLEMVKILPWD